jgi:hypothetical protein
VIATSTGERAGPPGESCALVAQAGVGATLDHVLALDEVCY